MQAESALPGDVLYPVKTGFNEKVMQVLAFSDEAKVNLSVQLAELRLKEAETLEIQGKITEKIEEKISSNFNEQAEKVAKSIEKLNNAKNYSDAEKISSDFEASLKARTQVLEKLKEIKEKNNKVAENINSIINEANNATEKAFESSAVSIGGAPSAREKIAQNRLQSAEEAVAELKSLIDEDKISEEDLAKAKENLAKAEEKIAEGKEKISGQDPDFASALSLFQEAKIIAKKSKSLIEVKKNFKLEINIDIEKEE